VFSTDFKVRSRFSAFCKFLIFFTIRALILQSELTFDCLAILGLGVDSKSIRMKKYCIKLSRSFYKFRFIGLLSALHHLCLLLSHLFELKISNPHLLHHLQAIIQKLYTFHKPCALACFAFMT
jgi:hypothetical protein